MLSHGKSIVVSIVALIVLPYALRVAGVRGPTLESIRELLTLACL